MHKPLNGKEINIVFWNIRSLLNKIEDVREKLRDENISILIISESWLKSDIPNIIDIDRHFNLKSFYDSMYKLVNHKLYLMKLIRLALTVQAALSVGKSMILSLIDYGNIFLTILTQEDKSDLQKVQNKVLRCCLDIIDPLDMNIIEMHNMVNVDLVDERRTYNLLTMTHRRVKADKFKMLDHQANTRYNDGNKIELIRPRNEQVRKSSYYIGTSLWNTLNQETRQLETSKFKTKIKNIVKTGIQKN